MPTKNTQDTSDKFVKQLAPDYKFFEWGYSLSISNQNPSPNEEVAVFETLSKYGLLSYFADWLKRFLELLR